MKEGERNDALACPRPGHGINSCSWALPAAADTPTGNASLGTQYGSVLRAVLGQNWDGSGYAIFVYGSGACSATYSDFDYSQSVMPYSWNAAVSNVKDYNACDVKLYWDVYFQGSSTGWINGGSTGVYVGDFWNDKTSSFRLSG